MKNFGIRKMNLIENSQRYIWRDKSYGELNLEGW